MAIQFCPGCTTQVNVPDGLAQLKVRCPICKRQWFHPPTVEQSDVEVRCANTGVRLAVKFSRRDPDARFTIDEIIPASGPEWPVLTMREVKEASGQKSIEQALLRALPRPAYLALPAPGGADETKRSGWLVKLATRSFEVLASKRALKRAVEVDADEPAVRPAKEFDWTGFACPCCHATRGIVGGSCGHLTCRGTVEEKVGGTHWRCSCGRSGFLTATLDEIVDRRPKGSRHGAAAPPLPALPKLIPERRRLPAPQKSLAAPKGCEGQSIGSGL